MLFDTLYRNVRKRIQVFMLTKSIYSQLLALHPIIVEARGSGWEISRKLTQTKSQVESLTAITQELQATITKVLKMPTDGSVYNGSPLRDRGAIDRGILQSIGRRVRGLETALEQILEAVKRERLLSDGHPDSIDPVVTTDDDSNVDGTDDGLGGGK